jgi:cytochrome c oxidase subunit 1
MLVMTLPWHWLGLNGQWRRVAHFNYSDPALAWWGPWVVVSLAGGVLLLASAFLFVSNLARLHERQAQPAAPPIAVAYALPLHPLTRVPAALNGFALWNVLVLILLIVAYGWPIAQFAVNPSPEAVIHRLGGAG